MCDRLRIVVLDNFHYLSDEVQRTFAFDLRVFHELGIRFVILGIWRERNRLTQFNGDLQDRVIEIPVEPWERDEFLLVARRGEDLLNVNLEKCTPHIIEESFESIGVFQELCKGCCLAANVTETAPKLTTIDPEALHGAIEVKLADYSSRHMRSIEAFADSRRRKTDGGRIPLYIPYYFVRVLLSTKFERIAVGLNRRQIHEAIKKIHHRSSDVRPGDMTNFLNNIVKYQLSKDINPPLFDYDVGVQRLSVIDSTLHFFLRHCDKDGVLANIEPPSDDLKPAGHPPSRKSTK